jgi:ubiquitin-conjugating enzyme E2 F
MLGLTKKVKKEKDTGKGGSESSTDNGKKSGARTTRRGEDTANNYRKAVKTSARKLAIRDCLLLKDIRELQDTLPTQCKVTWKNEHVLCEFDVTINPDEGYWVNGSFKFHVTVPEDYNMAPPKIKCKTRIWHPNINEEGNVCLSILRQSSIDDQGWAPTRSLKDVVWGVNSLFTDLLNFDDPLNVKAAKEFQEEPDEFKGKVRDYIKRYCESVPVDKKANQRKGNED